MSGEVVCARCRRKFSQIHESQDIPGLCWREIHVIGGKDVCRDCDLGIPCAYIRGTGDER